MGTPINYRIRNCFIWLSTNHVGCHFKFQLHSQDATNKTNHKKQKEGNERRRRSSQGFLSLWVITWVLPIVPKTLNSEWFPYLEHMVQTHCDKCLIGVCSQLPGLPYSTQYAHYNTLWAVQSPPKVLVIGLEWVRWGCFMWLSVDRVDCHFKFQNWNKDAQIVVGRTRDSLSLWMIT